jgi:hypothetical protein
LSWLCILTREEDGGGGGLDVSEGTVSIIGLTLIPLLVVWFWASSRSWAFLSSTSRTSSWSRLEKNNENQFLFYSNLSYPWLLSEITGSGNSLSKPSFPLNQ